CVAAGHCQLHKPERIPNVTTTKGNRRAKGIRRRLERLNSPIPHRVSAGFCIIGCFGVYHNSGLKNPVAGNSSNTIDNTECRNDAPFHFHYCRKRGYYGRLSCIHVYNKSTAKSVREKTHQRRKQVHTFYNASVLRSYYSYYLGFYDLQTNKFYHFTRSGL